MQETIKEKDILSWLAGFYDAEGCARISRAVRKKGYTTYRPAIIINNTDIDTIDYCILLLDKFGINRHVHESKPTTERQIIKYIEISRITKVIELCDILLPYLITKYDEFKLLKEFCLSRHSRFTDGNIKNKQLPYNDYEVSLYEKVSEYKAHKKGRKCLSYTPIYSDTPNDITWAWFSGCTDGDGSFSINKRGSASYCIATTNPVTSNKIANFFTSKNIDYYFYSTLPAKNHLSTCKLRISKYFVNNTKDILCIANNIKRYSISKTDIINVMIEYCTLRNTNKGKWRTEYEKSFVERAQSLTFR